MDKQEIKCIKYSLDKLFDDKGYLLLPFNKQVSDCGRYPVLYLCHGTGSVDEWINPSKGNILEIMEELVNRLHVTPMIVVIPKISDCGKSDDFMKYAKILGQELMPRFNNTYEKIIKTGKENTAIAGFSMGGAAALYYGKVLKDTFSYVGAFSPSHHLLPIPYATQTGWIKEAKDFILNTGSGSLNMIGFGKNEQPSFKKCALYYTKVLQDNHIGVNNHGEDITVDNGGHGFETFNELLKRFLKMDFFNNAFE